MQDLSYRYKVPLTLSLVIVITAAVVSAILGWQTYRDLRADLVAGAESLGKTLSRALAPVLLRDEVWPAYEIVVTPLDHSDRSESPQKTITVLDPKGAIYVSSHPGKFPMLAPLGSVSASFAALEAAILAPSDSGSVATEDREGDQILVAVPILADDGTRLGTVLLAYAESLFLPRFYATLKRVTLSTLLVLAILVPLGWHMGRRMAVPLLELAASMRRVGSAPRQELTRRLHQGGDEIGQLGRQFGHMLDELEEKQNLEKQMIAADRLAAIGRLTAGIAHEINNPLGGMMNAINTFKRHGKPDPVAARTLSLLERGLMQIRETVGALLVEARVETHALTHEDIEDIRTLLEPEARGEVRRARVGERARRTRADPLDAGAPGPDQPVAERSPGGVRTRPGGLQDRARKRNARARRTQRRQGDPGEQLDHLFEPFAAADDGGAGLGLWVTYQIVHQLKGTIEVSSAAPETRFVVNLPVGHA